jgi:mRNA deadenylase 3'-5' endonuclease subunit Ccr4
MELDYISNIFVTVFLAFIAVVLVWNRKKRILNQNIKEKHEFIYNKNNKKGVEEHTISILTYNILCQKYMKRKDRKDLNLDNRMNKITEEILSLNPDIFCLQEVNSLSYKKYFLKNPNFNEYSFDYGENYGSYFLNLIGYKRKRFEIVKKLNFDLNNSSADGNKGIFNIVVKDKLRKKLVSVYNVHFPWKPEYANEKCFIFGLIAQHIMVNGCSNILLVGDFNSTPNSTVFRMVYFNEFIQELLMYLQNNQCPYSLKFEETIKDYARLSKDYLTAVYSKKEAKIITSIIYDHQKSDEMSKKFQACFKNCYETYMRYCLKSAYFDYSKSTNDDNYLRTHPSFTNYTQYFKETIDYIFYSQSMRLIKILKLPTLEEVKKESYLPSSCFPSDHIKLYAEFLY